MYNPHPDKLSEYGSGYIRLQHSGRTYLVKPWASQHIASVHIFDERGALLHIVSAEVRMGAKGRFVVVNHGRRKMRLWYEAGVVE